jgi:hypothetical protein
VVDMGDDAEVPDNRRVGGTGLRGGHVTPKGRGWADLGLGTAYG